MASSDLSKYAENQILSATVNRFPLMGELLADTVVRAAQATTGNAAFTTVLANLNTASSSWTLGETAVANAEAALPAATYAFDDKLASLTRKPDADTSSLLEGWDIIIRGQVAYQGPIYMTLLPHGRETLTEGTKEEQIDALRDFGTRLAAQTSKPTLISLGIIVTTFATAARTLRSNQISAKSAIESTRAAQEAKRLVAAAAIYAVIGQGMVTWSTTPALVDTLWDVNIIRSAPQQVPDAPADTTWTPTTRTLSTTALPANATRLQAWREGPGGMPELLLTGLKDETALVIPANITFTPGLLYQLWIVAINSRGSSLPGPIQTWDAV